MDQGKYLVGALIMVFGAAAAGCAEHKDSQQATASSSSSTAAGTPTAAAPATYDIAKVGGAKGNLPPGFEADDIPADTVSQDQMDAAGIGGLSTAQTTVVTPPECAAVLKPFAPVGIGARAHGFMATQGQGQHIVVVMAAQSDKPAAPISHSGCDHFTAQSASGVNATVEQVPGPSIPGVPTVGHQAHVTADGKTIEETTFTAALGDKTIVVVQGDMPAETMSDLLRKAVTALQG